MKKIYKELIEKAKEAQKNAYAPYSHFKVGAALLTKSGKIITGCNVENSAYTNGCCAEKTTICKAVSEGEKDFVAIAIVGGDLTDFCYPCGACRQVMIEFNPNLDVIVTNGKETRIHKASELLLNYFRLGE